MQLKAITFTLIFCFLFSVTAADSSFPGNDSLLPLWIILGIFGFFAVFALLVFCSKRSYSTIYDVSDGPTYSSSSPGFSRPPMNIVVGHPIPHRPVPFFNSAPNYLEPSTFSPWSGTRTATGFGSSSRREDNSFGSSNSSSSSDGTRIASGFGGTSRREDDSFGSSNSSSSDGTQTK